ncbi:MAG: GHKL domain-containing protein [Bacteriovoracaceae bacterium]|nr:GHKL domain-containing protein [Bacteriovoracaceae bacterium]
MDTQNHNSDIDPYEEIKRLKKINKVLADKAEAELKRQAGSYSLFETNAILQEELHLKTDELYKAFEELRARQVQLWHSAKLSSLGEMAAGIAHEINNPLSVLLAQNHFLEEYLKKRPPEIEKALEMLKRSNETVLRISKIINGLRAISRDGESVDKKVASAQEVVVLAMDISCERFRNKGVEVTWHKTDKCWSCPVFVNNVQISQVLVNLLNNACDALEDIEEKWIKVECVVAREDVIIKVTDSGKGIDPKTQTKLFQPFFTTKELGKGTGLGLSVSKGIMEQHGGSIYLDNSSSNTCFVLKLPIYRGH